MSFDRKNGSVYFAVVAQILMSANTDIVNCFKRMHSFPRASKKCIALPTSFK